MIGGSGQGEAGVIRRAPYGAKTIGAPHLQVWFNEVRSRKPQTFTAGAGVVDPTGGGGPGRCDFCDWRELTAEVRRGCDQ